MITDFPDFESVNRLADLPAGRYVVVESTYGLPGDARYRAILTEIVPDGGNQAVGVDIQVGFPDGSLLFRDFARASDSAWRDSYGAKADSVADLFPQELARFELMQRHGTTVEHDGAGQLSVTVNIGTNHGT